MKRLKRWYRTLLAITGIARPSTWTSPFIKFVYAIYTTFMLFIMHALIISHVLDLVLSVENQDELSDNLFITVPISLCFSKLYSVLIDHERFEHLIDTLLKKPFLPMNDEERKIEQKSMRLAALNAVGFWFTLQVYLISVHVISFPSNYRDRKLRFRGWLPYSLNSKPLFFISYLHQSLTINLLMIVNSATDILFASLLICIHCELEILGHRLQNLMNNKQYSAKLCAHQHDLIYKFATTVNEKFKIIMGYQFITSTSMLCFDLYRLVQNNTGSGFVETAFYAICALVQIFYYCWYGNEVKVKSLEIPNIIFESNWTYMDQDTKMALLMIMKRATVSIQLTSGHIMSIDIETFKSIVKTSYSACSVLQQSKT